ncbi:hypothetical protein O1611_g7332 [Lasiodiplodia mahajangana]|uniref:Uncharacterized protein n=1 Tax=Lasiodiplodia mahajangana TaxID=1108764 RepID=A0ACC2JFP6_9PEZI|nr:hypothetical protein O1611_g7332 [Lasiodiplodia mahajangana]
MDFSATNETLLAAAESGDIPAVKTHLYSWMDPDTSGTAGWTPLHFASKAGYIEIADLLLEYSANPNLKESTGATPLHYAAQHGHDVIVQLLLDYKANPKIVNNRGLTPLHCAVHGGNVIVVKLLLEHGANRYAKDSDGSIPLHGARSENITRLLLGQTVSKPEQDTMSPTFPITINDITLSPWPVLAADASDTNYVVVQTRGKLDLPKMRGLEDAGLDHIAYVSKNTYLCQYLATDLNKIRQMWHVIFADVYRGEFKLPRTLLQAHHDQDYKIYIFYHKGVSNLDDLQRRILDDSRVNASAVEFFNSEARLTIQGQHLRRITLIDEVYNIKECTS